MFGAPWPEQSFNIQEGVPNRPPHPHMGLGISLIGSPGGGQTVACSDSRHGTPVCTRSALCTPSGGGRPRPLNVPGHAHSGSPNPTYWVILMWQGLLNIHSLLVHSRSADGRAARSYVISPRSDPSLHKNALTIWSASSRTVLRLNFLEQKLKRSSRLGPSSSITITL